MALADDAKQIKENLKREQETTVSIALFGQPGAGKSSLINKIVGAKVAEVGVETDKTVDLRWYEAKGLRFGDLPGYGTSRFPKDGYWDQFNLDQFDLFLCVSSGKLHQADTELFRKLLDRNKVCIFVCNKHDELWEDGVAIGELEARKKADIEKQVGNPVTVVFTSCRSGAGLDVLMESVLNRLGDAKRARWARSASAHSKKFLDEKRKACERLVGLSAGVSAVNALNPIPGVDVAVDLSVLVALFKEIRDGYGLSTEKLTNIKSSSLQMAIPLANRVLEYATKEGILLLLKRFLGRQALKTASKYVPFVGTAVAAGLGYAITSAAGNSYLEDCHKLAEQLLESELAA
jgi:hypothetical protein